MTPSSSSTAAVDDLTRALPFTLDRFPAPFADHPDLAELCIVVPPDDPVAWSAAMRIVGDIGRHHRQRPGCAGGRLCRCAAR